jgi:proto-oncogene tyrosine-protein kinase ROS
LFLIFSRARDIASGLVYLSDQNIIHADIAARNILVTYSTDPNAKYLAKIGNFSKSQFLIFSGDLGLSKVIRSQRDYYQVQGSAFPVKWSAPEVIEYGKFSAQSGTKISSISLLSNQQMFGLLE